jgi:uncharacterized glyoxalase superfamily protein PhnB
MTIKRITPVLLVDEVEPCVRFWVERMGFQKTVEVPDGDKLGFASLQNGAFELMYQSHASASKDAPEAARPAEKGPTYLYIEVDDLEKAMTAAHGAAVVVPLRDTFYGAKEIGYKDPGGHVIMFAQFAAASQPAS